MTAAAAAAAAALKSAERAKKKKYKKLCEQQRRMFVPFVVSCCGVFGEVANTFMQWLATLYFEKYDQPYPICQNYFNTKLDVTLVHACHNCIWGSQIPMEDVEMGSCSDSKFDGRVKGDAQSLSDAFGNGRGGVLDDVRVKVCVKGKFYLGLGGMSCLLGVSK